MGFLNTYFVHTEWVLFVLVADGHKADHWQAISTEPVKMKDKSETLIRHRTKLETVEPRETQTTEFEVAACNLKPIRHTCSSVPHSAREESGGWETIGCLDELMQDVHSSAARYKLVLRALKRSCMNSGGLLLYRAPTPTLVGGKVMSGKKLLQTGTHGSVVPSHPKL